MALDNNYILLVKSLDKWSMFYIYSKFCILYIKQSAIAQDIECVGFYQKVWGSIPWSAKKFKDSSVCGNK